MTPPGLERTKAEHTALAVRVAQNTRAIRGASETTQQNKNGEPTAPLLLERRRLIGVDGW